MTKLELEAQLAKLQIEVGELHSENQELRLEKEKFRQTFYNNQAMMIITDFDGEILDANIVCQQITGYTREELRGKSIVKMGFYESLDERKAFLDLLLEQHAVRNLKKTLRKKSGDITHVLFSSSVIYINDRRRIVSSIIDITEQKKTEEALRDSLKFVNQMFNRAPVAMIVTNAGDRTILEANESFLKTHGLERHEVVGCSDVHLGIYGQPEYLGEYFDIIQREGMVENYETEYVLAGGEVRTVLLSGALINYQGQDCILTISNDITELRKFQQEMSRLDSLHIIGQMSASLAHEIRNPMTVVRGFLQMFQFEERYQEDDEVIKLIIKELDRTNDIITNFLSLSQKSHIDIKKSDLNDHIHSVLPLIIVDALKNGITVQAELHAEAPVMLDQGEFRQLLLNLVRNGVEAMPEGGRVSIRTYQSLRGICMEVEDHGGGIPADILARVGTPFLTTKTTGTGLGLAVCYSIAERHKASIKITTSPAGTVVQVLFPPAGP